MADGGVVRDLVMPRLGLTMKQGRVTRWYKGPGETFRRGEALLQVTTEKVAVDVEANHDGRVVEVIVPVGKTVPVGAPIARIEVAEGLAGAVAPSPGGHGPAGAGPGGSSRGGAGPAGSGAAVRATPAARRVARELGLDLAAVRGTGPEGRITEEDVRLVAASAGGAGAAGEAASAAGTPDEVRPHSDWRLATAGKMTASARTVAPVTLHRLADFSRAALLLDSPELREADVGPLDLVIRAVADALLQHPDLNATFTDEALLRHKAVNIGVALALPGGLLVPVLRDVAGLPLVEIARRRRELWHQAGAGRVGPDDLSGGTFTVTNLGPFGVDYFTPIINPPEVAVLGVGRLARRPVEEGGRVEVRPTLALSLTFDHRAVDGAPAALFLGAVAAYLATPPEDWLPKRPRLAGPSRPEGSSGPGAGPGAGGQGAGEVFDLVIVGSGPAGFTAAVTAAEAGARVALVEAEQVGGVCLNRGCIPTKAALERLAGHDGAGRMRDGQGAPRGPGQPSGGLAEAVDLAVTAIRTGAEERLADLGVKVARGEARLLPPAGPGETPTVGVGDRVLRGSGVLLCPGSEAVRLELPAALTGAGGRETPVIGAEDLFTKDWGARRALVVGGGPGGVEASRILALSGASVTLVEKLPSLLPGEEEDVGELIRLGLEDLGVEVKTGTDVASLAGPGTAGGEPAFDLVVLAVGRRARLGSLGLEDLGTAAGRTYGAVLDPHGFVKVDEHLRTAISGVFAAGDVTGPPFWAHRAMEQGRAAAYNALAGLEGFPAWVTRRRGPEPALVPRVVFSDPEFGAVGLGRRAAEETGRRPVVGTVPMGGSSRARAAGKIEGFVRLVADRETGRLLGLEAVCPAATELVAAGLVALKAGLGLQDLSALPFAHPTYSESLGDAARDALRQMRS